MDFQPFVGNNAPKGTTTCDSAPRQAHGARGPSRAGAGTGAAAGALRTAGGTAASQSEVSISEAVWQMERLLNAPAQNLHAVSRHSSGCVSDVTNGLHSVHAVASDGLHSVPWCRHLTHRNGLADADVGTDALAASVASSNASEVKSIGFIVVCLCCCFWGGVFFFFLFCFVSCGGARGFLWG